jgi:hypothetical protein
MQVALLTSFKANKKEPVAAFLERVHAAFVATGEAPRVRFLFSDAPVAGFTSSIDRVLKRYPGLRDHTAERPSMAGGPSVRVLGDLMADEEALPFAQLLEIAAGIPRSFPFHSAQFWLMRSDFGDPPAGGLPAVMPGVIVGDSWWVSGRMRSVSATVIVEAGDTLPPSAPGVAAVMAACGKADKTSQIPLPAAPGPAVAVASPAVERLREVVERYRADLDAVMARAGMPHDLPPALEAERLPGAVTGPRKPALDAAFKPLGYSGRGESGTFTFTRRTTGNLAVEVYMDVGTWSASLTAFFKVQGPGFAATLPLLPSIRAGRGQYPLGDASRWAQIVENLAALVRELDRTFVPEIESVAGPAPAWFRPAS